MINKKYLIFLSIFIFNLVFFHFGLEPNGLSWNKIYKIDGDSKDYIQSVENLLNGEGFTFFKTSEDTAFVSNFVNPNEYNLGIYYAFRSPGFAFFYLPLRWIFNQHYALICFLFLQVLITAIAKYYIAKIAELISDSKKIFWVILVLINITPYFVQYNNLLITESLGLSFTVFGIYLFIKNQKVKNQEINLLLSGLFFTIAFMLRPFLAVFPLVIAIYIFIIYLPNIKLSFTQSIYFVIPIVLITGTWTFRNYVHTQKIIPLASTMEFQNHKHLAYFEMMKFCKIQNISDRWFDKYSPVYWLITLDDSREIKELLPRLTSKEILNLNTIKHNFHKSLNLAIDLKSRQDLEHATTDQLKEINTTIEPNFTQSIQTRLSASYLFLNPKNLRLFHVFKYPLNVVLVFFQSIIQNLTLLFGVCISFILFIISFKNKSLWISIVAPSLFLIYFFGFLHQTIESREAYTYSFIFLISIILFIFEICKAKKWIYITIYTALTLTSVWLAVLQTILEIKW